MDQLNKNSKMVGFLWFLLVLGIVSFAALYISAEIDVVNCKAIRQCSGGEGIAQGGLILFGSVPLLLISTIVNAVSFVRRRKNDFNISQPQKILLYTSTITIVTLMFMQTGIFWGLFNYIRDGVELILGI